MSESEAKSLFKRTLQLNGKELTSDDDAPVDSLLKDLGYLPLVITQAAAYMSNENTNPKEYHELLKVNPIEYLKQDKPNEQGYDVPGSVLGSSQLSFKSFQNGSDELLYMISFFGLEEIPKDIVIGTSQKNRGHTEWKMLCDHLLVEEEISGVQPRVCIATNGKVHEAIVWSQK